MIGVGESVSLVGVVAGLPLLRDRVPNPSRAETEGFGLPKLFREARNVNITELPAVLFARGRSKPDEGTEIESAGEDPAPAGLEALAEPLVDVDAVRVAVIGV